MDHQQSSEINQPNFQDQNNLLQTIATPKQSQPTKNKVNTFKTRVFRLLRIYAQKSKDISPLLKSINQDIFYKQPKKVNEIILILINQRKISTQPLKQLCSIYKNMLLYKQKKHNKNTLYAETFIKIIKKMQPSLGISVVQQMLQIFSIKRKCKLHVDFFFYIVRKIAGFRQSILQKCQQIFSKQNLRPAQKRQIQKLQNKLNKKNRGVKQEE